MLEDPKSSYASFFALFGFALVKAVRKMLMKSTEGVAEKT